jgi:hypothetical protein
MPDMNTVLSTQSYLQLFRFVGKREFIHDLLVLIVQAGRRSPSLQRRLGGHTPSPYNFLLSERRS